MNVETGKNAVEGFLDDQKSHIVAKQFRLLGTTVKTVAILWGMCLGFRNLNADYKKLTGFFVKAIPC